MKRSATVFLGVVIGLSCLFSPNHASAYTAGQEHYPDLQTLKPSELRITRVCSLWGLGGCQKYLRFSNTAWNSGNGRFEMRPQNNPSTGKTTAYQRVYSHDATGSWYFVREFPVGQFSYHSSHSHWHFEGFANYSLVTANASDTYGVTAMAGSWPGRRSTSADSPTVTTGSSPRWTSSGA